ncbi:lamin tail domain-containing protein, partial [Patescibacteria group bacterium]|nr:lamin tail domain-containing protein [Patescibacteria group bacterium]
MVLSGAMPSQVIAQAEGYKLVISEVMWMGSDISTADEWLEFVNVSSGSINISGWKVDYLKSDEEAVMFEFPQGTLIEAGQYFVVSNYDQENSRLAIEPDLVDSSISLPNSKLHLWLKDSDGNIMDEVDDGSGAPFAGENPSPSAGAKASMERIDIMSSGSDKSNWMSAETSLGFDEGVEIYGTPGYSTQPAQGYIPADPVEESGSGSNVDDPEEDKPPAQGYIPAIPKVLISEVFPNPEGKDDNEWIEIINYENYSVDVSGWKIKRGNEEYVFEEYVIRPDGIFVLGKSETDLSLKNSGDTIELL